MYQVLSFSQTNYLPLLIEENLEHFIFCIVEARSRSFMQEIFQMHTLVATPHVPPLMVCLFQVNLQTRCRLDRGSGGMQNWVALVYVNLLQPNRWLGKKRGISVARPTAWPERGGWPLAGFIVLVLIPCKIWYQAMVWGKADFPPRSSALWIEYSLKFPFLVFIYCQRVTQTEFRFNSQDTLFISPYSLSIVHPSEILPVGPHL